MVLKKPGIFITCDNGSLQAFYLIVGSDPARLHKISVPQAKPLDNKQLKILLLLNLMAWNAGFSALESLSQAMPF